MESISNILLSLEKNYECDEHLAIYAEPPFTMNSKAALFTIHPADSGTSAFEVRQGNLAFFSCVWYITSFLGQGLSIEDSFNEVASRLHGIIS